MIINKWTKKDNWIKKEKNGAVPWNEWREECLREESLFTFKIGNRLLQTLNGAYF